MSALVEKALEESLGVLISERLSEVDALVDTSIRITTAWSHSPDGEEHAVEQPSDEVTIAIAAGAPQWDEYLVPSCSIPVALAVSIRRECAPDAKAVAQIMEPIANIILALQLDVAAVEPLSSENFSADGVRADGGNAPTLDTSTNTWRITRSLIVRGVICQ